MKLGPRIKLALKLAAAVGLLAWLVAEIGGRRIVRSFSSTDLALASVAFVLICADNVLRSYNWRILLGARGRAPGFGKILYSFLVGGFFGSFIPSSLGPDAARTVALAGRTRMTLTRAGSSVVMLNVLGLWALGAMFLAGVVVLLSAGHVPPGLWVLAGACGIGVLLLPTLLATRAPLPRLEPSSRIGERLVEFAEALAEYRTAGRAVWTAAGVALVNQAAAVLVVFTVFRAGGLDVPLVHFLAIVPVIHVARLIPATVAGFGAEQGVVVGLFGLVGVQPASALAMSVIVSGLNLAVQALSGLLYVGVSARTLGRTLAGEAGGSERDDDDDRPGGAPSASGSEAEGASAGTGTT